MSTSKISAAILPPATLGLLGGGQLGRFFVGAAHELGYRVTVLDPDPHSPAGKIADEHIVAVYEDKAALERLTQTCAAVTTEFENVPAAALSYLAKFIPVRPSAEAVAICQNRSAEKRFLKLNGFPHAPYADIVRATDLDAVGANLLPGILKAARFGYDGKGQVRVANLDDARLAFAQFNGEPCVLERLMPLECELSVVLARDSSGAVQCFPVAQNQHRHGILDITTVPADVAASLQTKAKEIAEGIAQKMHYIGTMAVEFFVVAGELFVNEMAPRPHNSGHYTIDACITNQYEQQVRALCNLPLGDASAHSAAVMVNLLGDLWYIRDAHHSHEPDWHKLLSVPNLKLHLYGKHHARPGRKMGHFTVIGNDVDEIRQLVLAIRRQLGLEDG